MAENKPTKHEPPKSCKLRRWLFGASPSAILGRCLLGLRTGCKACKGCRANVHEIMMEAFEEGLARSERPKIKEERREVETVTVISTTHLTPYSLAEEEFIETQLAEDLGRELLRQGLVVIDSKTERTHTDERVTTTHRAIVQVLRPAKEEGKQCGTS